MNDPRTAELAANLQGVEERVAAACSAAGRQRDEVTVVVVTKTWPAGDVRRLAALGVQDVGENRDQEAAPKAAACADLGLRWHFVGRLQSNKCRSVARYADVVHSLDRPSVVHALGKAVRAARLEGSVRGDVVGLVQVSIDSDPDRGGAPPGEVERLADLVAGTDGLVLGGVMAVAPLGMAPDEAFARLAELAGRVQEGHPGATVVSAGMSGDLEQAVAAGATHLRVGSAVLGARPPLG